MWRVVNVSEISALKAYETFADGMLWVTGDLQVLSVVRDQDSAIFLANPANCRDRLILQDCASLRVGSK
jgi:hypothetical protein